MFLQTAAKLLLSASLLLGSTVAHNIQLPAHGRECFHESLRSGDKMTVTFQYEANEKVSNGDFSFDAKHDGKYVYCFGNEHWGASSKGLVRRSVEARKLSAWAEEEQSYIVVRERTHRNTAESTNSRVWWLRRFFEFVDLAPL
ncbi:hypothetical protein NEMBOFW57_003196 [Staphylotrichum longicolle]|uniref:GOLD domain-containing protein n=1 Tax=Staphylotrichum longicolle TaxID=669026 RepID=A0AAD4F5Q2_9PEZI|nr:hypothetical protein NEMBOFW57_003196 [Staphylotrichum longicolle]